GWRQVGIVVTLAPCAVAGAVGGRLPRIVGEAPRMTFVMRQSRARRVDAAQARGFEAEAIVDIVIGDGEALAVETAEIEKEVTWGEEACRRHRAVVARDGEIGQVAVVVFRRELECRSGEPVVIAMQDPRVLHASVGIRELRTDGAYTRQLR